ncbi:MAG: zinc/manganese transport system substrate-binding protein [Limisphaerales bacterium]|jgi:zinc/manganese transport system substrate-binding protein
MKLITFKTLITALTLVNAASSAELRVVATLPDCAAIAREIVSDKASVTCLAGGAEDPHFVSPRPSYTRTLNRADLLIVGGADLEIGWLPPLVSNARNRDILPGGSGRFSAASGIRLLDVPSGPIDRSQGHIHAAGNPHFLLDPLRGKAVAGKIAAALARSDPKNKAVYQANLTAFHKRLDAKLIEWQKTMSAHQGAAIVTYHSTFDYFAERYGLRVVGQLEPKPGIPPTPGHIRRLVPLAKDAKTRVVAIGSFRPKRLADQLARQTGATVISLPVMPTDKGPAHSYIGWIDQLVGAFDSALK